MPKNKVYDKDTPWDLLMETIEAVGKHAEHLNTMIVAHNRLSMQINQLNKDVQNLNKRITRLERRLHEIG